MTRQSPASTPEDLCEAIGKLLESGQREYFYQRNSGSISKGFAPIG